MFIYLFINAIIYMHISLGLSIEKVWSVLCKLVKVKLEIDCIKFDW